MDLHCRSTDRNTQTHSTSVVGARGGGDVRAYLLLSKVRPLWCSPWLSLRWVRRRGLESVLRRAAPLSLAGLLFLGGCSLSQKKQACELDYPIETEQEAWYRGRSTAIEYPCLDNVTAEEVQVSQEPRNLHRRAEDDVREFSLQEAITIALSHNQIVETSALGGVGSKLVLTNPSAVASVYDPAIQESGVLFGRRGLDAALADFDTRFASSLVWGRDDRRLNTAGAPAVTNETSSFTSSLSKSFATGGSVSLFNNWNYQGSNQTGTLFPSTYSGSIGTSVRQPLLAGSGVDFTRTAGPVNPAFGSIAGVSQGVVIARINQDITLADFELSVQNALIDIENAYWDLFLAYRSYDTAVWSHTSALETWRNQNAKIESGGGAPVDAALAEDRLYETKASVELSLNQLYKAESELRRLIGLPMNDGTVLRPSDEPTLQRVDADWKDSLADGLTHRIELRRQKWQIKSLQLQLDAARSLVRPRLDAVGSYAMNGFGDRLSGQTVIDPGTGLPIHTGLGSVTHDDNTSWTMGVELSVPIGFRQARSQVRNYELQLAKANAVLASQERNISHDIAMSMQDVSAAYEAAQSSIKRLKAAEERVRLMEILWKGGGGGSAGSSLPPIVLDDVVRAQSSAAVANLAYYQQVTQYNKSIAALKQATGTTLRYHNVSLAEGPWCPEAYCDAELRSQARSNAFDNSHLETQPPEFVSPGPAGSVELQ